MESIYLKTFLEVAKTGSFTQAAENLSITQSAVSRRIKFMEVQYNCQLLDRSDALLKPTAYGEVVQEKAERILSLEQELLCCLKQAHPRKELTFACTPTFGVAHLPKIQREFALTQTEITDLNFILENPEEILKGLKNGRYEMAVVEHCRDYDLGEFQSVSLPDDDVVFAVASDCEIGQSLDNLLKQVLYGRNDGCCSRKLLEKNLQEAGRQMSDFRQLLAFDDLRTIIDALARGDGVAFLSRDLIVDHLESGALSAFYMPGFIHSRKRSLIFSDHLHTNSFATPFIEQVLTNFETSSPTAQ